MRSLQARLLWWSGAATLAALLVAGLAIGHVLGRFVVDGLDRRLDANLALLASTVDGHGRVDAVRLARVAPALDAGPGWRWRIHGPDGTVGATGLPPPPPRGRTEGPPGPPPEAQRPVELGDGLHARTLVLPSPRGPVELLAAAPRAVLRHPLTAALTPLLLALGAVALLLGGAALVQLRLGLRPLRRLRDGVAAIRAGTAERVDEDQPSELQPLAAELNALAAHNRAALAAARTAAANLAHALKTPLATLALDVAGDPIRAGQVARLEAVIRHHLARARLDVGAGRAATPLAPAVAGVAAAVRRLRADTGVAIMEAVPAGVAVAVDPADLDELVGNLLDNAAVHARTRVRVGVAPGTDPRLVRLVVEDDGPGIPAVERAAATRPGVRLDERTPGHGFGLAIVAELAALYGGTLALEDAAGGGLRAVVALPTGPIVPR